MGSNADLLEPDLATEQPTTLDRDPPGSRRFDTLRAYGPRILVLGTVAAIATLITMLALLGRSTDQTDSVASSARSLASSVNTDCATGQVVNTDTCAQAAAVADDPRVVQAAPSDPTVSPVTVDQVLAIVNDALADARREDPGRPLDQPAVTAEVGRQLAAARIPADDAQVRQIVASALAGQQRALSEAEVRGIVASALADQPAPVPGPQGEQGPPGPTGPAGPAGPAGNPPSGWTFTDSTGRAYTCTRSNADDATPRYACSGDGGPTAAPTGERPEPTPETTPEEPTRDDAPN